jgi:hypothetical protein
MTEPDNPQNEPVQFTGSSSPFLPDKARTLRNSPLVPLIAMQSLPHLGEIIPLFGGHLSLQNLRVIHCEFVDGRDRAYFVAKVT